MRIALIGADGQLGTDLHKVLKKSTLFPFYYPEFDITKPDQTRKMLAQTQADVVINTAAYHRVDECEDHPKESFLINSIAVRDLAIICKDMGSVLVHFSTDYVFDGQKGKPYDEQDRVNPLNVYAVSKLAGELFIQNLLEKHFIIRTCGLYGEAGCREKGTNFVDKIISFEEKGKSLAVVNDQWVTPTSTAELAKKISELISTNEYGLFHMTNEGECTWYEFTKRIFEILGRSPELSPILSENLKAKAKRPRYSVLENTRAKQIGLSTFSPWEKALEVYLEKKGHL